jgi:hypothetical protein
MVQEIRILLRERLLFQKVETLPRGGGNPAMIFYRVERLIEHSSVPAGFLSAQEEDLSKQKTRHSPIFGDRHEKFTLGRGRCWLRQGLSWP